MQQATATLMASVPFPNRANRLSKTISFRLLTLLLCLLFSAAALAGTYFVNTSSGNDGNTGASWAQAFKTLQKALATAGSGDQIWVAQGTYYPDEGTGHTNDSRTESFFLKNGVTIYGGFVGTETFLSQRNPAINVTTLSGDLQQNDGANFANNSDNSYHVVRGTSVNNTAVLDGFTIKAGNANGAVPDNFGGAITNTFSSPSITNCSFPGNTAFEGGAIFNTNSSSPTITNCSFPGNAASFGGAIANFFSSLPTITNCSFSGNTAANTGGAIYNNVTAPAITNCKFSGNAAGFGGAIANTASSSPTITNCSFTGNMATDNGGAIYNSSSSSPNITNCILWGDTGGEIGNDNSTPTVTYSIVQGGFTGTSNLNQDPVFVNAAAGNLRLQACSPAINVGSNIANSTSADLDGNTRVVGGTIDMGAYEFQGTPTPAGPVVFVNVNASGANNGTSWTDAFTKLQDAMTVAASCSKVTQIWVAEGTYYPDEGTGHTNDSRTESFFLKNGVTIYGGFVGTETLLSQRNPATHVTILSGDLKQNDGANFANNGDNAYHVVRGNGSNNTAVLDGFTIKGGNANGSSPDNNGGAIYNEISSSPTITNCSFTGNMATNLGGAILNNSSSPTITNCSFSGNSATNGGAIYNSFSFSPITNCSFTGNMATDNGGAIYNDHFSSSITNCSFTGNSATNGGGAIVNDRSFSIPITNCILWGDTGGEIINSVSSTTVTYSIVQGGYTGTGNLDQDPLFVNAGAGNLRLLGCSPAINSGDNTANSTTTDRDGNPRIFNGTPASDIIDRGAYEYQGEPAGSIVYVKANAGGANDGTSWTNAFTKLQDALAKTGVCANITQIWVAEGTYYPDEGTGLTNDDRTLSFNLKNGVAIYGGFVGTETLLSQRNPATHVTVLSGDLQQNDGANFANNSDNALHIVRGTNINSTAVLDGFTITAGNANNAFPDNRGAGIYNDNASPTIANCSISGNTATGGPGIRNINSSSPTITNCSIMGNVSTFAGAGILSSDGILSCTACIFKNNTSHNGSNSGTGGAVQIQGGTATFTNCLFDNNKALGTGDDGGGAIMIYGGTVTLINSTIVNNQTATHGGAVSIFDNTGSVIVKNSILWNNTAAANNSIYNGNGGSASAQYSLFQDNACPDNVSCGLGMLFNKDPIFVSTTDFHLEGCSPAINTGLNSANSTTTDLDGNPRIFNGAPATDVIDRGAYEFQGDPPGPPVITGVSVNPAVLAPPNHKMRDVIVNYTVSPTTCSPVTTLSVVSSEPVTGTGDGDTDPDWIVDPNNINLHHVQLRAERSGQGDGRVYTITITATDSRGMTSSQTVEVHVSHNITSPQSGATFKVGSTVSLAGTFWDKPGNKHTAQWLIDGSTTVKGVVTEPSGTKNGKVTGSYKFTTPGIYKLQMNVTDQYGVTTYANTAGDLEAIVVIYDPNGGYTYGGGWFASPQGALTSNGQATGKVSYGFSVNYYKGATNPKGENQFDFEVGGLEYNALNFDYLSISGAKAQFKGSGRIIGGQSGINFIMTVIDGALDGTGIDKARIKIYNKNTGQVFYDNEPGSSDAANPTTPVGTNSTVVISGIPVAPVVTQQVPQNINGLLQEFDARAHPNPTRGYFALQVTSSNDRDPILLQVFDQLGRHIETRTVAQGLTDRIGTNYIPGVYYFRVTQGKDHKELKVLKLPN